MNARAAIRDMAASVRQRLLNRSRDTGEGFQILLTRYGIERLLYRLSRSEYADQFLLKGALLFDLWYEKPLRPTRDADLLRFGSAEVDSVRQVFQEVCGREVEEDGINFEPASVVAEEIRLNAVYPGIRVRLRGQIGSARVPIQVDVGFGDAVVPGPEEIEYPTLLEFPAPVLRAYTVYTVIAEKFHAVVLLGEENTRLKDYFDLHAIIGREEPEAGVLIEAIRATFERRDTSLPEETPPGLTDAFAENEEKIIQWRNFLSRNQLDASGILLPVLVEDLRGFFDPVIRWMNSSDSTDSRDSRWRVEGGWSQTSSAADS